MLAHCRPRLQSQVEAPIQINKRLMCAVNDLVASISVLLESLQECPPVGGDIFLVAAEEAVSRTAAPSKFGLEMPRNMLSPETGSFQNVDRTKPATRYPEIGWGWNQVIQCVVGFSA